MARSLSALESKLILHLEWEKQPIVTIEDASRILNCSHTYARKVLQRLARNRWLEMIVPGKYELIPAERGEYAFSDTNPLFIGSNLISPYYFSYSTAAFYHGLTTQSSQIVFIATTLKKTQKLFVRERIYQVINQPSKKFFGFADVDAYGSRVFMAEPEKTILDNLDKPSITGDIPEVATMLWRGKDIFDWDKLADYAIRFQSQSLIQRLGYIALLAIPLPERINSLFHSLLGKTTCYLGQPSRWQGIGTYNAEWKIVDNIPRHELLADIEVR